MRASRQPVILITILWSQLLLIGLLVLALVHGAQAGGPVTSAASNFKTTASCFWKSKRQQSPDWNWMSSASDDDGTLSRGESS